METPETRGLHPYRFKDNPEEKRFAEAWAKQHPTTLSYLLDPASGTRGRPPEPTDREHEVAATVIQWLGSPVGQGFLRDLGYSRDTERKNWLTQREERALQKAKGGG